MDALEHSLALPSAEFERIGAMLAEIGGRIGEPAASPAHQDRLVGLIDALNGRVAAMEGRHAGIDLLATIVGEVSVTLNRLAISHAGAEKRGLGAIVLENGPLAIRTRLKPVLEAGREARLLRFDSSEDAYRTFYGLVVRDTQIRLLLGEELTYSSAAVERDARAATAEFFALYGAK